MDGFLTGNEWQWRLLRTIAQGVTGVVIANLDLIVGFCLVDPPVRALVVALVMAVLGEDDEGIEIPRGGVRRDEHAPGARGRPREVLGGLPPHARVRGGVRVLGELLPGHEPVEHRALAGATRRRTC